MRVESMVQDFQQQSTLQSLRQQLLESQKSLKESDSVLKNAASEFYSRSTQFVQNQVQKQQQQYQFGKHYQQMEYPTSTLASTSKGNYYHDGASSYHY